eukprot:CAMPEP_0173446720 /NCGR_PEP_ID=MMETSP1357-20121228/37190_1 /TAXON_ID=77926 /ORGANISM="Hemiselmis rufescens, Strain PCC563" /LENGTH=44 /DNA_ID= /DNA_START= /DNA_END= /DNA_ORIENTATION=
MTGDPPMRASRASPTHDLSSAPPGRTGGNSEGSSSPLLTAPVRR